MSWTLYYQIVTNPTEQPPDSGETSDFLTACRPGCQYASSGFSSLPLTTAARPMRGGLGEGQQPRQILQYAGCWCYVTHKYHNSPDSLHNFQPIETNMQWFCVTWLLRLTRASAFHPDPDIAQNRKFQHPIIISQFQVAANNGWIYAWVGLVRNNNAHVNP